MKLRARREVPTEANLFEPWERLLLVSIELDDAPPAMRELAAACFACLRHMAGKITRDDAYRAVRRALVAARGARGGAPESEGGRPSPSGAPPPIPQALPFDDGMTIRVSRATYERFTEYARERELEFGEAVDRLVQTAARRRAAVNKWNRKPPASTSRGPCASCGRRVGPDDACRNKRCAIGALIAAAAR